MRRHRWPALAPPADRGLRVHPPTPIVAEKDLDLELSAVTAFTSGLLLQLAMRVTGIRADFARYETRPLTDPNDWSARWSDLSVQVRADDLDGPADALHRSEPPTGESGPYRATPSYWIGAYPRTGKLTVTTSWTEIGLHRTSIIVALGPSPFLPRPNPVRDGNSHRRTPSDASPGATMAAGVWSRTPAAFDTAGVRQAIPEPGRDAVANIRLASRSRIHHAEHSKK